MRITKSKAERKFSVTMNDTKEKKENILILLMLLLSHNRMVPSGKKPKPKQRRARFTSVGFFWLRGCCEFSLTQMICVLIQHNRRPKLNFYKIETLCLISGLTWFNMHWNINWKTRVLSLPDKLTHGTVSSYLY